MLDLTHKTYQQMGSSRGFIPLRPFGPSIGHATLPQELVNDFNEEMDKAEGVDWSHNLVGNVSQELQISPEVLTPPKPPNSGHDVQRAEGSDVQLPEGGVLMLGQIP